LYQIPVVKIDGLTYGKYKAVIRAIWEPLYDHVEGSTNFDFYLDAIRIYNPTNGGLADGTTDTVIEDAYKADGEGWPSYMELRDQIIAAGSFDNLANEALPENLKMDGLVFIDGDDSVGNAQMADYISYGPNNEVYIAPGQRVAFILSTPENINSVHIGIKSADGATGTYTVTNIVQADDAENNVSKGTYYGAKTHTISTTTDMYYDLTGWKNDIIVISNTGNRYNTTGVISVTNIKSTYTSDPNAVSGASETGEEVTYMYMTAAATTLTLRTLNTPVEDMTPEENIPEVSEPEVIVPDKSEPVGTVPEESVVVETLPNNSKTSAEQLENSESKGDIPARTEDEESKENVIEDSKEYVEVLEESDDSESSVDVEKSIIEKIIEFVKRLFSWLFNWLFGWLLG
ncbi:MAG: hypothetical protein U0L59_03835, partial [Faecalimonas sp.]|nr:hypothetical protein [Faecalimonas sp.]